MLEFIAYTDICVSKLLTNYFSYRNYMRVLTKYVLSYQINNQYTECVYQNKQICTHIHMANIYPRNLKYIIKMRHKYNQKIQNMLGCTMLCRHWCRLVKQHLGYYHEVPVVVHV